MRARDYAKALFEVTIASPEHSDRFAKNLEKLLTTDGKKTLLSNIAKELAGLVVKKEREQLVLITTANDRALHQARQMLTNMRLTSRESRIVEKKDPSLIGGYRIETHTTRFDETFRRKLLNLYDMFTDRNGTPQSS